MIRYKAGDEDAAFDNRRIEIQVRTRLQHSWATAVEAVGLFRGEDMKGGAGNSDWLRMFELMASEFASAEGCAVVPGAPDQQGRQKEIREINVRLNCLQILENIRKTVEYTQNYVYEKNSKYYIVKYNSKDKTVEVSASNNHIEVSEEYYSTEIDSDKFSTGIETVVVEVGKIESLIEAYPNYFGDVRVFMANLQKVISGKSAVEYTMPPQSRVPPVDREAADMSWFRRTSRQRPRAG